MTITITMTFEDAAEAANSLSRMGEMKDALARLYRRVDALEDGLKPPQDTATFSVNPGGEEDWFERAQALASLPLSPSASAALESARGLGPKPAEPSVGHVAVFSALTGNAFQIDLAETARVLPKGVTKSTVAEWAAQDWSRTNYSSARTADQLPVTTFVPSVQFVGAQGADIAVSDVTREDATRFVADLAAALTSPPVPPAQPATVPTPPTAAIAPTGVLVKPLSSILIRDTVSAAQSGWTEADFERVYGTPFSPPGTAGPLFSEEQVALAKEYQGPDGPARWAKRIYDAEAAAIVPPTAPAAPDAADLDVNGMPWDSRLHAGTKTKNADGTWRALRKAPAAKAAIEADIKASQAAPAATVPPPPGISAETFAQYMARISPVFAFAPSLASADMTAALAAFGLTHIGQLASRPDLIPGVDAKFQAGAAP